MFSQTVEYGLRAVVCLAAHALPLTAKEIAARMRIPPGYLAKIMQGLARSGIIASKRGKHGGFTLARPAEEITVLDVVSAIDPIRRIVQCPLDLPEHAKELCPLHRRLDDAAAVVEGSLRGSRISDMTGDIGEAATEGQGRARQALQPLPMARGRRRRVERP